MLYDLFFLNVVKVTASHSDPRRYFGKELKLAKSLALVLFLFAVSWLPLHILNCITLFLPGCETSMSLIYIAIILSHGNSAVNPIVYAFRIKKFRTAFRKIWKQYMLCQDPIGRLPQRGSQRGQSRDTRLRQNDDDDDDVWPLGTNCAIVLLTIFTIVVYRKEETLYSRSCRWRWHWRYSERWAFKTNWLDWNQWVHTCSTCGTIVLCTVFIHLNYSSWPLKSERAQILYIHLKSLLHSNASFCGLKFFF